MGLFDKVKKGKEDGQEDLSMDFPLAGVMDEQAEDEDLPTLDALVGGTVGLVDGNSDSEKAVLDESLSLLDDALAVAAPSGADDELAVLGGDDPAQDDDDGLGDLMDIFTNEEEEDVDLTALLSNLEEVSGQELLDLALEVSEGLRLLYTDAA
jgi:hypothetical protein